LRREEGRCVGLEFHTLETQGMGKSLGRGANESKGKKKVEGKGKKKGRTSEELMKRGQANNVKKWFYLRRAVVPNKKKRERNESRRFKAHGEMKMPVKSSGTRRNAVGKTRKPNHQH